MALEARDRDYYEGDGLDVETSCLPISDTFAMIQMMPEGSWEIPYKLIESRNPEDDSFVEYDQEEYKSECEEMIGEWVDFFDSVDVGRKIARTFRTGGNITINAKAVADYSEFYKAMRPRLVAEGSSMKVEELIDSCRNAFTYLLPDEKVEEKGLSKPEELMSGDIENAKMLVEGMVGLLW